MQRQLIERPQLNLNQRLLVFLIVVFVPAAVSTQKKKINKKTKNELHRPATVHEFTVVVLVSWKGRTHNDKRNLNQRKTTALIRRRHPTSTQTHAHLCIIKERRESQSRRSLSLSLSVCLLVFGANLLFSCLFLVVFADKLSACASVCALLCVVVTTHARWCFSKTRREGHTHQRTQFA